MAYGRFGLDSMSEVNESTALAWRNLDVHDLPVRHEMVAKLVLAYMRSQSTNKHLRVERVSSRIIAVPGWW